MKIGVLSDTHLRSYSRELEQLGATHFRDVDLILHAGDIVEADVLDAFSGKTVKAVAGNMDRASVRNRFPMKQVIQVGDYRIGLIHGWGDPVGMEDRIFKEFTGIQCLVYGHTHTAANHVRGGILFFNPGSATEQTYTPRNTVGILSIENGITGTIITL